VLPALASSGSFIELLEAHPLLALLGFIGIVYILEILFPGLRRRAHAAELAGNTNRFVEFVTIAVGDFLRVVVVWVLLYLFDLLTKYLPVAGFAGTFIHAIHQAGSVALVLILVIWLLIDVIQSLRKKK
jgi:hypothetical protein